jgi:hypothetical protein
MTIYENDTDGTGTQAQSAAAAGRYRDSLGWSSIPLRCRSKAPKLPKGHPYLSRRATEEEFARFDFRHNVGVVTGKVSGIVVLDDDDGGETLRSLGVHVPPGPTVKTRRGHQHYFRYPEGFDRVPTFYLDEGTGLQVKADGGYVAAPPSIHPSGVPYEWVVSPREAEIPEAPEWLISRVREHVERFGKRAADVGVEIPKNRRNKTLFSLACTLRNRGLDEAGIRAGIQGINQEKCKPPLEDDEVAKVARSAARYESGEDLFDVEDAEPSTNGHGTKENSPVRPDTGHGVLDELIALFKTAKEATSEEPESTPWVARPWAAEGAITELAGKIKSSGKTTFCCRMAACALDGKPFMGQPTVKTPVVVLTEQTPTSFTEALEDAGLTDREDVHILYWKDAARHQWPRVVAAARQKCKDVGAKLLIADTLAVLAGLKGEEENNAGKAHEVMVPLKEAAAEGLAVIYTRHDRKSGGPVGESGRGSSAFGGDADLLLLLRQQEGQGKPTLRVLESLGRFRDTPSKLVIELTGSGYRSHGDTGAYSAQQAMKAVADCLPASAAAALTAVEIINILAKHDIRRTAIYDALETLSGARTIVRIGKGKKGDPYRYYKPEQEGASGGEFHSSGTPTSRGGRTDESGDSAYLSGNIRPEASRTKPRPDESKSPPVVDPNQTTIDDCLDSEADDGTVEGML